MAGPSYNDRRVEVARDHIRAGRRDEAEQLLRQVLAAQPNHAHAQHMLGVVYNDSGRYDLAVSFLQHAAQALPQTPEVFNNLGEAYRGLGQVPQAIAAYERAIALRPQYPIALNNLGIALQRVGHFERSLACYQRAIALRPDYAKAYQNLAGLLVEHGQHEASEQAYLKVLSLKPDYALAHSNYLFTLYYTDRDPQAIAQAHFEFGRRHADALCPSSPEYSNDRNPDRPLRIGYISPDLREHAVSFFIEGVLDHHDRSRCQIVCYSNVGVGDAVTQRLASKGHEWCDVRALSDAQVQQRVRDDRIDILVDLAGHTAKNRLLVLARRPAPVQASYIGYPNTTGMRAINYRITDAFLDPPGMTESQYCEQLVRLPDTFAVYRPPDAAPPVGPSPFRERGYITFGSFNHFPKVTPPLLARWARVLERVAGSKLFMMARSLGEFGSRKWVLGEFARHGIGPDRLVFQGGADFATYLTFLGQTDIALDTFPCNGHTTTCHSLWMGVPVVAQAGRSCVQRLSTSVLNNVSLPELVAQDEQSYIDIAVALATDPDRLASLRQGMRQRMQSSALLDGARLTLNLEGAYRQMWRQWLASA